MFTLDSADDAPTPSRSTLRRMVVGKKWSNLPHHRQSILKASMKLHCQHCTRMILFFTPALLTMILLVALFAVPLHVVCEWFINFLHTNVHCFLKAAALHYAAFNLCALVTKLFVEPLRDRYGKATLIVISSFIMIVGWLVVLIRFWLLECGFYFCHERHL